jgi:hypothetical protein
MTQDINRRSDTSAAARMRLYRRRRREQLRCVTVELHELELEALIHRGWLKAETRNDPAALNDALHAYLGYTLLGERDA